jgi:outer membrane protein assembly factor BamC
VTQAASQAQTQAQLSGRVAPRWQGVTRLHEGGQHWLLVNATPEQVWPLVGNFLKERGYGIAQSEPAIGLMESEWKVLTAPGNGALGLREQVRLRVESYREPGRTEVFLNLKLSEAAANGPWSRGAADEERGVELLNRLAQYLGASKIDDSVPETPVAAAPAKPADDEKPNRFLLGPTTEEEKAEIKERWERIEETCAICPPR